MNLRMFRKPPYPEIFFLVLISGLVYLPYIPHLTYFMDDWYYIYDGVAFGPKIFHWMFSIDRPARGYFFDLYFSLFGPAPFPYHLGAYLWRLFAGLCALRLFSVLWRGSRQLIFFSALLFVLFPGYAWWVSAIEYQPMIASLGLQVFSCMMTVEAVRTPRIAWKVVFACAAILSGWVYIALVDYAIGMEVFRYLCVYLLVSQTHLQAPRRKRVWLAARVWAWNLLIPLGFIFWRGFLFEGQRKATDIRLLLADFRAAPAETLSRWSALFFSSLANTGVYAWFKQIHELYISTNFNIPYLGVGMLISGILVLLVLFALYRSSLISDDPEGAQKQSSREAILLGLISLTAGILPVVAANRHVNLTYYSHYGLPASLGSAVLLAGLVSHILPSRRASFAMLTVFVVLAAVTHSYLARRTITLEKAVENFWRQVSWRVPDLRPDSTLVTLYPFSQVVDSGDLGLDDPANLIYFPETQTQVPLRYPVSALMPTENNVTRISTKGDREKIKYRVYSKILNYGNILVLAQPSVHSCVRVVGGPNRVLSDLDPESIRKLTEYSRVENIRIQMRERTPPRYAFGPEPARGWCYYFEKADLEVQRQDWQRASAYGDEVLAKGLAPADVVEWFPFIQAYAMTGDEEKLKAVAAQTGSSPFFEGQVCEVFRHPEATVKPPPETGRLVAELFCN